MERPEFREFDKITRLNRNVIVTEKIDGTNAHIVVSDDGSELWAASRNRYITPEDDNYGFAKWVARNREELLKLGPGRHFGEWWGAGIQRRYNAPDKRLWLFNTSRWRENALPTVEGLGVVPILWQGVLEDFQPRAILNKLAETGSVASPGFMQPEGIVVYMSASGHFYKMTLDKNDQHKGLS